MKNLITLLILITIVSCSAPADNNSNNTTKEKKVDQTVFVPYISTRGGISVVKIDECEYVYVETPNGVAIIHKANCKNYEHKKE